MINAKIIIVASLFNHAAAFFWDNENSPFQGLREQLFGNEGPMYVYSSSATQFSGDPNVALSSSLNAPPSDKARAVAPAPAPAIVAPQPSNGFGANFMAQPSASHAPKHFGNWRHQQPGGPVAFMPYQEMLGGSHPQLAPNLQKANEMPLSLTHQLPMATPIQLPTTSYNQAPPQQHPYHQYQQQSMNAFANPTAPHNQPIIYGPMSSLGANECPAQFLCCDRGSIYRNQFGILACCQDSAYDLRFEQCGNGLVVPLKQGMPEMKPADKLARLNCGLANDLYIAPAIYQCCNGTFYDATKFKCSDSSLIQTSPSPVTSIVVTSTLSPIPRASPRTTRRARVFAMTTRTKPQRRGPGKGPKFTKGGVRISQKSGTKDGESDSDVFIVCEIYRYKLDDIETLQSWGCCGSSIFNYKLENCTDGEISRTTINAAVDFQRPTAELMIYCLGGVQHWIDPSTLAQTRCCGSELCPLTASENIKQQEQQRHNALQERDVGDEQQRKPAPYNGMLEVYDDDEEVDLIGIS